MSGCQLFTDRRRRDEPITAAEWLNSIIPAYNILIGGVLLWGVNALICDEPRNAVSATVWPWLYPVWVALHIFAPAVAFAGELTLTRSRRQADRQREKLGWKLHLGGDTVIAIMLLTHVVALFAVSRPGFDLEPIAAGLLEYLKFFVVGAFLGAVTVSARDYLKGRKCGR